MLCGWIVWCGWVGGEGRARLVEEEVLIIAFAIDKQSADSLSSTLGPLARWAESAGEGHAASAAPTARGVAVIKAPRREQCNVGGPNFSEAVTACTVCLDEELDLP